MCCCYKNKLRQLENENETMSLDIEKLEKYVAGLTKWNSDFEANVHGLEEELQQKGTLYVSFTFIQKYIIVLRDAQVFIKCILLKYFVEF